MDADAKKTVLRKITYGLYVLTASAGDELAAGTVNWLSQASFTPPLVMIGVKTDSGVHALIERSR
ncbi:MAG: flavin reductase, partial [Anaerolineales bacterium]|nr:flavin reductase [Anaerolineales bacterium]